MRSFAPWLGWPLFGLIVGGCGNAPGDLEACVRTVCGAASVRWSEDRARRFLGQVNEERAHCRGRCPRRRRPRRGPWVDGLAYWATGDAGSR